MIWLKIIKKEHHKLVSYKKIWGGGGRGSNGAKKSKHQVSHLGTKQTLHPKLQFPNLLVGEDEVKCEKETQKIRKTNKKNYISEAVRGCNEAEKTSTKCTYLISTS